MPHWAVADRLLAARLAGHSSAEWERHERALGTLPPGGLGEAALHEIEETTETILGAARELGVDPAADDRLSVEVVLSDGTRITDTILGRCADPRPGPALVTCSKVGPKRRVPAFLDLVALVATDPATPWRSVVVGAPEGGKGRTSIELVARGDTETDRQRLALHALEVAVDCYRRGMLEPIPLFTTVSYKLHRRCVKPDDWQAFGGGGEGQDEANRLVFGDLSLSELPRCPAREGDPSGSATRASRALRRLPVGRHRDEHRGELLSSPSVFSLLGPLPEGRVAIEASAGTGKTYTLAGLVVRYVAEADIPLDKLLIVTFTRAAAAELRDRVRTRLTEAVAALSSKEGEGELDELLSFVASTDRQRRLERLERALVDFDAATITTIHGFAQQVLCTLGSAAPGDLDARLLEDTNELLYSVCADVLAAESFADPLGHDAIPTLGELLKISAKVLTNPGISVVPDADDDEAGPARDQAAPSRGPHSRRGPSPPARRRDALLRRPFDPAARRARERGRHRYFAPTFPDRPHRRIPGHGPGAMGHLLPPLRTPRGRLDLGARRRPEAGDLRL